MKAEVFAPLYDAFQSGQSILRFVEGRSLIDYISDDLLRSGVERKFEVIGEALNRIRREDSSTLDSIRNFREIISFRNILVHGYDAIDDRVVWEVVQTDLGPLLEDIQRLLDAGGGCLHNEVKNS